MQQQLVTTTTPQQRAFLATLGALQTSIGLASLFAVGDQEKLLCGQGYLHQDKFDLEEYPDVRLVVVTGVIFTHPPGKFHIYFNTYSKDEARVVADLHGAEIWSMEAQRCVVRMDGGLSFTDLTKGEITGTFFILHKGKPLALR